MPIPQASSQWGMAPFVPESAWGRILFSAALQLSEWLKFWCMRSCPYEKRPDLGKEQRPASEAGILSSRLHPLPNCTLICENRSSRSGPKGFSVLQEPSYFPCCNYCISDHLSEDCQFVIFYWCYTWLCKEKTKASTNPMHTSKYLLLFPRMSYPLLALYLFTVSGWREFSFHLSHECFIFLLLSRLVY